MDVGKVTVASLLEEDLSSTIERWMKRVNGLPFLTKIPLNYKDRTGHLPRLLKDIISRLRLDDKSKAEKTTSAHDHGKVRFEQGYSLTMLVEESRLLQISIFDTLHRGQERLDFQVVLRDVMTIADECDSQLKHTVETFIGLQEDHLRRGPVPAAS